MSLALRDLDLTLTAMSRHLTIQHAPQIARIVNKNMKRPRTKNAMPSPSKISKKSLTSAAAASAESERDEGA